LWDETNDERHAASELERFRMSGRRRRMVDGMSMDGVQLRGREEAVLHVYFHVVARKAVRHDRRCTKHWELKLLTRISGS
jgi:hypothetical protein